VLDGARPLRSIVLDELREPILGWQRNQVIITGIRLSVAGRSPLWYYAKLIPQDCADLICSLSSWGQVCVIMARPGGMLSQRCLLISIYPRNFPSRLLNRTYWVATVWYVCACIPVWSFLRWLVAKLVIPGVSSHLVYDIRWCTV
jgi:hypothetical protein